MKKRKKKEKKKLEVILCQHNVTVVAKTAVRHATASVAN